MGVPTSMSLALFQQKRAYDEACKRLLAEKEIRARILQSYVREFEELSLDDIRAALTDEVEIGSEPVGRDELAAWRERGSSTEVNSEDATVAEGTATFDVRFRVTVPHTDRSISVEIDLEAQNGWDPGYPLVSRAVFYCARMLSSQGNRILPHSEYDKLYKAYSIWICPYPDRAHRGSVSRFGILPHDPADADRYEGYDLMEVRMVCLDSSRIGVEDGTLGLLSRILATDTAASELKQSLEQDFGIMMTEELGTEVDRMCNLSDGVFQRGYDAGLDKGKALSEGVYQRGYDAGYDTGFDKGAVNTTIAALKNLMTSLSCSLEQAMDYLGVPASDREQYGALIGGLA